MPQRPVVYLLPGLLCDASVWAAQVAALSDIADIRTPDFLGFDDITAMAQSVLDTAPPHFAVVGHSMGARVALEIVRLAPARVTMLGLLDTGTHAKRQGEADTRQILVDLARTDGMRALAERWLPPMVHPDTDPHGRLMERLHQMVERATPDIFEGQVRALLERPDAQGVLPTITCPVLIGVGRQDTWSPPVQHAAMAKAISHARYIVFENSGHMAPMEAPDVVSEALRAWILSTS